MCPQEATQAQQIPPFPGAVDVEGRVSFTLYAPGKKMVNLIGDFNDWNINADPMHEFKPGLWTTEKELPRGSFAYQFLIDQELIICDPYARYVDENPVGGPARSVVKPREDPYVWRHDNWQRPRFEDLIIYEMTVADFTPQRTFMGAIKRLPYVRDLGMTAIELMPVFGVREDPGWGYSPVHLFAVNKNYGRPNELRALIDEAHGLGMAVLLDMVLAHTGPDHPFNRMYFRQDSPWYGPDLNEYGLPMLDYHKEATRFLAKDVCEYWLNDFHIDGFRFDYIRAMGTIDGQHGIPTLTWAARQVREDTYLIGEDLPENPPEMLASGMDGSWHVYLSYAMKGLLTEKAHFDYNFNDFRKCVNTFDPQASGYGERPTMMINYVESHDEERLMLEMEQAGVDKQNAHRKSSLAATILFTLAGEPMIYSGQSWGEKKPKNMAYNFQMWEELDTPEGKGLHDHFQRMARFRLEHDCLRSPNIAFDVIDEERKCLAYHRWNDAGNVVVVAANFSGRDQDLEVLFPPRGNWRELFSEQQANFEEKSIVHLEPYSAKVFTKETLATGL